MEKKIAKLGTMLSRAQAKKIVGGDSFFGSATASCGSNPSVTCKGTDCSATDGVGCSCTGDKKDCKPKEEVE